MILNAPYRGDRIRFRTSDGGERDGTVSFVRKWKDRVELMQSNAQAQRWAKSQGERLGGKWQSVYWDADVETPDKMVNVDCTDLIANLDR